MSSGSPSKPSQGDAKPSNIGPGNSSDANSGDNKLLKYTEEGPRLTGYNQGPDGINPDFCYDMRGDKHMYIFNHYDFKCDCNCGQELEARDGTNGDVTSLRKVFGDQLGFTVEVFNDKKYSDLFREIKKIVNGNYINSKCVCLVFLTHGDKNEKLYAADKRGYKFKTVLDAFYNARNDTLNDKPKLFFVQACRGMKEDTGTQYDGEVKPPIITPTYADYFIMRSTVEDYASYRTEDGSWMIQDLCELTKQYYEVADLTHLATMVQRKVASNTCVIKDKKGNEIKRTKQMPETSFTLRKFVRFSRT